MATIKVDKFGGIQPRLNPALLGDSMAQMAHNCTLKKGKLIPLREPSSVEGALVRYENGLFDIANTNSIHAWKRTAANGTTTVDFLAFPGIVWFSPSNIADDENDRLFVSGATGIQFVETTVSPSVTWPNAPCCYLYDRNTNSVTRHCICKNHLGHLEVSRTEGQTAQAESMKRYTFFFATWVDAYGYESGVSDPSLAKNGTEVTFTEQTLEYYDGDSVSFQAMDDVPADAEVVRIYKVVSGTETEQIQFVADVTPELASTGFVLKVADEDCGESIPMIVSPRGDLVGITKVPGNYFCGWSKSNPKTVMFSEIDMPTSWPTDYWYDVSDNVVTLAVTMNSVFALTDGEAYGISGTAPESMTISKLAGSPACISERGVAVVGSTVYYVSPAGVHRIYYDAETGLSHDCITERYFEREWWQKLNPSSCIMGHYDNKLFLFFRAPQNGAFEDDPAFPENASFRRGLVIDLSESASAITTHDEVAMCLCPDGRTDDMYFVRDGED